VVKYISVTTKLLLGCVALFAFAPIKKSLATVDVKVESNGFLRRADDRSDSSSTISGGIDVGSQGEIFTSKADPQAIVQITDTKKLSVDSNAFTVEAQNAYLGTSTELMPHHQFTLGRRLYDWARFDDEWQFGTYSPRFLWDPTRPETIGLTGAFYSYTSKHFRVLAYASPINIPERGYPLRNENGKLSSTSPFSPVYPNSTVIAKQNLPINYVIDYPPTHELIANPGAMASVRYSEEENGKGYWAQALYGVVPINQVNLAIQPFFPAQADSIQVHVHPEIERRHILTLETGIQKEDAAVWASFSNEIPTSRSIPDNWIGTSSEPAKIYSAGGNVRFLSRWNLNASYIFVDERVSPDVENQDFSIDLGGRFPYHRAVKSNLDFTGSDRITYTLGFVDDIIKKSQMATFDVFYRIVTPENTLVLNLGSDFFASATNKGYIGQYEGNDRVRGAISYAF
jgi:hypothetical protein